METANHHVAETVALDASPAVDFVSRDVLGVASHIGAGVGVGANAADACHEFVVLIGDVVLSCQLRDAVDFVIQFLAQRRVGHLAVLFIASLDGVEQRFLGSIVAGAELFCALEHEVLEVVGQTGGLGGVVTRTGAHGDVSRDARRLRINTEEDFQAIAKRVALRGCGVARIGDGLWHLSGCQHTRACNECRN